MNLTEISHSAIRTQIGALLMAIFLLIAAVAFLAFQWRYTGEKRAFLISLGVLVLMAGFVTVLASSMGIRQVTARFERLLKQDRNVSIEHREIARRATMEMARDRLLFGWGAGCYRFGFPTYQLRHDEISWGSLRERLVWEHAHSDYPEALAELGIAGCSLLVALLGCGVGYLIRARFWRNPLAFITAVGLVLALVHAWIDFPFQNPAVLTTWWVLLFGAIRWSELDEWT